MEEKNNIIERQDALVKEARAWSRLTQKQLLFRLASLKLQEKLSVLTSLRQQTKIPYRNKETPLDQSLVTYVKRYQGELDSVGFSFLRKGIFLERGVGRGRPVGSPQSNLYAKPWLKPVLDPAVEELADLLADRYADLVAADIRLLIPGVMDTKIQGGKNLSDIPNESSI